MQDAATLRIAARAGDAATVLGTLALAVAAGQVTLGNTEPVLAAAERTERLREHPTKILQGTTGNLVFASAVKLEAIPAFLKLNGATGHHLPVACRRRR